MMFIETTLERVRTVEIVIELELLSDEVGGLQRLFEVLIWKSREELVDEALAVDLVVIELLNEFLHVVWSQNKEVTQRLPIKQL